MLRRQLAAIHAQQRIEDKLNAQLKTLRDGRFPGEVVPTARALYDLDPPVNAGAERGTRGKLAERPGAQEGKQEQELLHPRTHNAGARRRR